ncbi:MAG TPA: zinc ABC transporter substrate-binding protein [Rhodospirillales bacterium]
MPVIVRKHPTILAAAIVAIGLCFAPPATVSAATAGPDVVASIAPVHSLVAKVMAGVGEPRLLVAGGLSPHTYALKPSDAKALAKARAVFWIGPELERFLEKPLSALAGDVRVVRLGKAEGVRVLPARKAGAWAEAAHDDGDKHGHDDDDNIDAHLWLDPRNAARMVDAVVVALSRADVRNAARYRANGENTLAALRGLETEIRATLKPVAGAPYLVFHDAFQYFETRFGLAAVGAVSVGAERSPGARRIAELRQRIRDQGVVCMFTQPQFEPELVKTVIEGTGARIGVLDDLGAGIDPGPGLYDELLRSLARSLAGCLKPAPG